MEMQIHYKNKAEGRGQTAKISKKEQEIKKKGALAGRTGEGRGPR